MSHLIFASLFVVIVANSLPSSCLAGMWIVVAHSDFVQPMVA